jgi:hypothetical protein
MMLFIPIQELTNSTPAFCAKIAENHQKYIGNEALFSIGGLNDLNTPICLTNGKQVTICTLLQSIPALEGMLRLNFSSKLSQTLVRLLPSLPARQIMI